MGAHNLAGLSNPVGFYDFNAVRLNINDAHGVIEVPAWLAYGKVPVALQSRRVRFLDCFVQLSA